MGLQASLALSAVALAAPTGSASVEELIAAGDAGWERRSEGRLEERPAAGPIQGAIDAFSRALEMDPENREARWKMLRALYYLGEYAVEDQETRLAIFERGRNLAESGIDALAESFGSRAALDEMPSSELADRVRDRTEAARTYFWATVHWGLWGRTRGKLAAAREGVADRIRDYAARVIALDETLENAGGHRILGRLHHEAPRIPFITGWVDKDIALEALERAHELAPDDLLSRVYLGELLVDEFRDRRAEGWLLIEGVAAAEPDPGFLIEELHAIDDARLLLEGR